LTDQPPQYGERLPGYRPPSPPSSPTPPPSRSGGSGFGRSFRRMFRPGGSTPIVTWVVVALCVFIYLLELVVGLPVVYGLSYYPPDTVVAPWEMLTAAFVHSPTSIWHILFNMYTLLVFGPIVELWVGRGRYIVLYLMAAFAGSVAVLLLAPGTLVLGASGAIFGLLAAVVVIQRGLGANPAQLVVMIVLNLAIGFFVAGVAWQAHVGGLVVGALIGWIFVRNRGPRRRRRMIGLVVAVGAALTALTVVGVLWHFGASPVGGRLGGFPI